MTVAELTQYIAMAIPIITFSAFAFSVFLFVKNKGTIDALKEATETYKTLAEAYEKKIDDLQEQLDICAKEINRLRVALEAEHQAMEMAINELIAGFKRAQKSDKHDSTTS